MGFWFYMLLSNLLIPAIMIGFGLMFIKRPPKTVNYLFGYRTTRSMKNQDTWAFAHQYCGRLWFRWGLALLPVTLVVMLLLLGRSEDTVGTVGGLFCLVQAVPLVGCIFPTEAALKRTFDKDGNRRPGV